MTSIADDTGHRTARKAYETIEPFHVLAYFNPGLRAANEDTGLDAHSFYVGARAAPMGDCHPFVVVSSFYNFAPDLITTSWDAARAVGLDKVAARRVRMLDEQLRTILADRIDDPQIPELTTRYREIADGLPLGGRPLAAAWAAAPLPDEPHVALWHAIAVIREWRGDNHIAVLVNHGLDALDAVTFHEAELPDTTISRRILGRKLVQLTRGWSDEQWDASVDRLIDRGLAARTETGHQLTESGLELYRTIESDTDALTAPAWSGPDVEDLLTRTRPYVKAVIDAGVLPGTRKKD
ncbi:SCO6745 family protein [Gordonia insulae]|uniref:SalK n=1 Tax=Gordonia insulae TaxID=2420509 RepID=A0A3G8JSI2_9ACTN|nr:hypothetical protein [Gordonia insulae]AZG47519.1 hypothetical protein D7316_04130 [Gordonia insulae]